MHPYPPLCLQIIFPIYLTASPLARSRVRSFPGVPVWCLCVVQASVGLFISTEKAIWAAARLSASGAISLGCSTVVSRVVAALSEHALKIDPPD